MSVVIRHEDFNVAQVMAEMRAQSNNVGAMVTFVGLVRDMSYDAQVNNIEVQHYPGMSEKALEKIITEAHRRWELIDARVIHRIGTLGPNDQIVLVATASSHRGNAFSGCEFIIDYLKTDAPFWKKEVKPAGGEWVETRETDIQRMQRWNYDTQVKR